jgi:hypothetical protein
MPKSLSGLLLIIALGMSNLLLAQEVSERNWTLNGYLKNLQTGIFTNNPLGDTYQQDNLLHNRLNFRWFPNEHFTLRAELRTRAFYGDLVRVNPNYAALIDNVNNDHFDWSTIILDRPSWVVHTMLDRFYLEYNNKDWEFRAGRQRINWGINTVWNPNDIFNAFAFTDFDYEERPGSDALSIKRYTGFASSIELVAKAADSWSESVIASRWQFNRWAYDFQLIGGYVKNQLTLGGGWAGSIKNVGFKGEWTTFFPLETDLPTSFALSLGTDYIFENSLYLNGGYLYNSNGSTNQDISQLFNFELAADNLYPYRHALFGQISYPVSPLVTTGLALIYSPVEVHPLFLNPTATVSIANNWDLDFIGQIILNQQNGQYTSPIQAFFLRIKWSY